MSMTESEAIQKLEFLNEALNFQRHDADECSCALQMGMDAIKEVQQYRAIGTVSEFRELKEKATAKKPKLDGYYIDTGLFECPSCGRIQKILYQGFHCKECGQKLDWSEGKE